MFCSVKMDKKNNSYKFYLCDRYRDKQTGKVKSSDKYIMTLQEKEILSLSNNQIKLKVENILINKDISIENIDLILEKLMNIKNVVIKNDNTTFKNEKVEIVEAEIVEECNPTYATTIMFDVQKLYRDNIETSMRLNSISKTFGIKAEERFEIEKEQLKKIQERGQEIEKEIDDICEEYLYVNELNEVLKEIGSEIRLVQDIYIDCYTKHPTSEVWLIGGGYITRLYGKLDLVLPGYGEKIFECWEEIKEHDKLDDSKAYLNHEEYFEEIDLYRESNLYIDESDITGSLVRMILGGNYEIGMSCSGWIDINVAGSSTGLSIEHFIDWVNNKPTNDYKVTIDSLMDYKEQLYKFKKVN